MAVLTGPLVSVLGFDAAEQCAAVTNEILAKKHSWISFGNRCYDFYHSL